MKRKLDAIYLGAAAGESTLMSNLDLHFLISLYFILFERGWRLQTFIFHKTNFHLSLAEKKPPQCCSATKMLLIASPPFVCRYLKREQGQRSSDAK